MMEAQAATGSSSSSVRTRKNGNSPHLFLEFGRAEWEELAESTPQPLTAEELEQIRGLGEQIDLDEVVSVYLPLSRLLNLHTMGVHQVWDAQREFLRSDVHKVPFIIAVSGSVAVGKSTTARLLQALLSRWPGTPKVDLVTTDGFLYPNAVLEERGLLDRKGFPESYDRRALLQFVAEVKAGRREVAAPLYSHLVYDVLPDKKQVISSPDILILEGLNVLQHGLATGGRVPSVFLSDFFDFSVYVDAQERIIKKWYIERFMALRQTAFTDPDSFFKHYARLTEQEALDTASGIWDSINGPNLVQNILPTRGRARLILSKGENHRVERIRLRRI
ncbi:type I pantothenate kinase [Cumulibacter soli]|uniref:type I pantothenate kinase n=1 Tax=Cumulibacter soli TaxID=2546344 RepID=UPI0014199DA4|nr:type I pantothenate kinase [Cumulibacter soli]